jgi:hypothetical protein
MVTHPPASPFFPLDPVPDRVDRNTLAAHPVQHDVGSPSDDQLPDAGSAPARPRWG